MVICLERGADLHLAPLKSRLVLLFWYWPTRVVLDKGPFNRCVCVCVCVCVCELELIRELQQYQLTQQWLAGC